MFAPRRPVTFPPVRHLLPPLVLISLLSIALLMAAYGRPLALSFDAGEELTAIGGLHEPEENSRFSYAYTRGAAWLRLPWAGVGHYDVRLRLAGPGGAIPLPAQLRTAAAPLDLGTPAQLRHYYALLPADADGDLRLELQSATTRVPGDERRIGLLLDQIEVRSVGGTRLPLPALLGLPLAFLLLGPAVSLLATRLRWQLLLGALLGVALALSYAISRGRFVLSLPLLVLGGWLFVALVLLLSRLDGALALRPWRGVVAIFLVWRAALWALGAAALWYSRGVYPLAEALSFNGAIYQRRDLLRAALTSGWLHWDSEHYLAIASQGYTFLNVRWPTIAFFPLYPLLMRLSLPIVGSVDVAALLVANLACLAALLLLYDLVAADFGGGVAYRTILLLLLFPTSLFLVAGYSESLALALTVAAVWAMRRQRWWLAGIAGALLALTRLPGVLIAPAILLAYFQQRQWRWRAVGSDLLAVLLPPAGLALFMAYQWQRFGTPTAFLQAQQSWENRLSLPWVMPSLIVEKVLTTPDWPIALLQAVAWLAFLVLTALALRRLPLPYAVTALLLLLPPYLSRYPWSMSRYVLIAFPAFVVMARTAETLWLRRLLVAVLLPLLVIATILFVNGFWVA